MPNSSLQPKAYFSLARQWVALLAVPLGMIVGCGGAVNLPPDRFVHSDRRPIAQQPRERKPSLANEIIEMSLGYQIKQVLDIPRVVRKLSGNAYEAINVDNFDQVPNSTWFTNRNGHRPMTLEAIRRGPTLAGPPAAVGPLKVVALKSAGVTPGMTVVDTRGERYIVKFDPPDFPELASGTEVVGSKLFYAAGYHVPENYIFQLDFERLHIQPGAMIVVRTNDKRQPLKKRPLNAADLQKIIAQVNPQGLQRIRVLASRYLPGVPVGPWRYTGVRADDGNDIYPHEHRREIRGLYVIASWLNHADMKEENTLDMYDPEARVLTHYLIDFGASMGSNSTEPSNPRRGQANAVDFKIAMKRLSTLGLYVHDYEKAQRTIRYPAVGYLENDLFKPDEWNPLYPVPAFENRTKRDVFWGTNIVTSFTDEQIEEAVSTGKFSNPDAAAYMVRFLTERRDRIGAYWFARTNTLDQFECPEADALNFIDLAIERGYAQTNQTQYRFAVYNAAGQRLDEGSQQNTRLDLDPSWRQETYIAVSLVPQRPQYQAEPVWVYLQPDEEEWSVVGLRRRD